MENLSKPLGAVEFELTSVPELESEAFLSQILADMDVLQPKCPLQCVTIKMPLPAYLRMKKAAQKWNLTYTDIINFCTQRVVPVLEAPSGEVARKLEAMRLEGESRKTQRKASRRQSSFS